MSDPKFELRDELAGFIEALHDSEINGEIGWFYNRVWRAKIGDPWNGYRAETEGLPSLAEAAKWLRSKAIELYPTASLLRPTGDISDQSGALGQKASRPSTRW
jgi:hypothetical protein